LQKVLGERLTESFEVRVFQKLQDMIFFIRVAQKCFAAPLHVQERVLGQAIGNRGTLAEKRKAGKEKNEHGGG
jgi:hypothetical protein